MDSVSEEFMQDEIEVIEGNNSFVVLCNLAMFKWLFYYLGTGCIESERQPLLHDISTSKMQRR